jgi:DNA-binding MarR family transcriptional regulator
MRTKNDLEETLRLMAEFGRLFRSQMRIDPGCPTMPQLEALQFVKEHETPSMRDIAGHLKVKAPSATSLISELVRSRMLVRRGDPNDRRQVRLHATERGTRELSRIFRRKRKIMESMLMRLDEHDRQELNRLLQKVLTTK